ncbi:16835_t:CDS:2 [Gigaspora margarita]|uniref:polynucleotide adenylyltransferase n=1 Tax=Gigaspora margarita TaxID=4874 RepID=A0ABN7UD11_GIGMA|nr:16835_t:CDS:2 [Gigaspora margarita]
MLGNDVFYKKLSIKEKELEAAKKENVNLNKKLTAKKQDYEESQTKMFGSYEDNDEFKKFEQYLQDTNSFKLLPTSIDQEKRKNFVKKIETILKHEWPNVEIKVNISTVNLLGTSTSDVDICVTTPSKELENMLTLSEKLQKYEMKVVKSVPHAKVPIVKFCDPTLKLACDINVNNAQALSNTNLIKSYVSLDSRVRPLVMIIKHWARRQDLNDAACGTLLSYTWTCMVLNFLQMRYSPILPVLKINEKELLETSSELLFKNNESIGGLLFAFFKWFAYNFDYKNYVISLRLGKYLNKWEKNWLNRKLCIEEPFNPERNLGNGVNNCRFKKIIKEFRRAVKYLYNANLELCCQLHEIYNELEYDEYEYCHANVFTLQDSDKKVYATFEIKTVYYKS